MPALVERLDRLLPQTQCGQCGFDGCRPYAEAMARGDWALNGWLLLSGPLTALPLLFFGAAARRLPLATVGLVQYLSPTLQFVLGVWVFHEPMQPARLLGFALIWAGLALYSADALRRASKPVPMVS